MFANASQAPPAPADDASASSAAAHASHPPHADLSAPPAPSSGVSPSEAAAALRSLLDAAHLPLDLERSALLQQALELKAELKAARASAAASASAAARSEASVEAVSRALTCPITCAPMVDPVVCADGQTYERAALARWFASGSVTSPVTNARLPNSARASIPFARCVYWLTRTLSQPTSCQTTRCAPSSLRCGSGSVRRSTPCDPHSLPFT